MIKRELKREGQERKKIAKKQREWEEIKLKERKRGRDSVIGSIRDREEERGGESEREREGERERGRNREWVGDREWEREKGEVREIESERQREKERRKQLKGNSDQNNGSIKE